MLILGLDPGSRHTGYGLVRKQGSRLTALGETFRDLEGTTSDKLDPVLWHDLGGDEIRQLSARRFPRVGREYFPPRIVERRKGHHRLLAQRGEHLLGGNSVVEDE